MSVKKDTIIRTVILALALINQCLTMAGVNPIPVKDEQLTELLSLLFTVAASMWAWWKNNSFTQEAIMADEVMHDLKAGELMLEYEAEEE